MAETRIRRDRHGLHIRTGGYVFRPIATVHSYPLAPCSRQVNDGNSEFSEGAAVKAHHMSQTPFGELKGVVCGREWSEIWHSHGCYLTDAGKQRPTDQCFLRQERLSKLTP